MTRAALAMMLLLGCGSTALKRSGDTCNASSECGPGLLCDMAKNPPVCAGMGVIPDAPPTTDAAPPSDGQKTPDAQMVDAAKPDAATPDAMPDAAPDAAPADAPTD
jgi:hypothetical protein